MSTKEGRNQDDPMASGKPGESSLTDLLHGLHDPDKESWRTRLNWRLAPVLIASLCLSVVLIMGIYRIGVEGFRVREKVEELAQKDTQIEETLKSMEEEILYSKQEPKSAQSIPVKSVSEKPRPLEKRTSEKPSKISKIMYRVRDGDSLAQIGEKFGVSVEQLCSWNTIEQTDVVQAGQVLIINMTTSTEDLPSLAQDGGWDEVAATEDEGGEAPARGGEPAEEDASEESDSTTKEKALEQIAAVRAETEAANKAIAQLEEKLQSERKIRNLTIAMLQEEAQKREALEGKLAADYISKQTALEQISEAEAKAEAANKAVAQLEAKLDSERKEHGQRVASLEAEAEKRKALEKKFTTDDIPKEQAIEQIKEATAKAEAASRAVSELQTRLDSEVKKSEQTIAMLQEEEKKRKALEEKLATDFIPKQVALEQISEAEAKAEAAIKAITQLEAKLDSERKGCEQTRKRLEEEPVTERAHASRSGATKGAVGRQETSTEETGEYPATQSQETSMGKPIIETVHVIRDGENLYRIGIKYGVSWKTLVKFNNLVDANAIYVGQKIRIPTREKAGERSTALDER